MTPDVYPEVMLPSRRRALCVGIDAYAGTQQLTGAVADATRWRDVLAAAQFEVTLLLDRSATWDAILTGLRTLMSSSRPGDVVVFTFAGCGAVVPDQAVPDHLGEAFLPVDYEDGEAITSADLSGAIASSSGVVLTCFVDCCFQGTVTRSVAPHGQESGPRDQRPRFVSLSGEWRTRRESRRRETSPSQPAHPPTVVMFNACRPTEVAWERDGQGEFTRRVTGLLAAGIPGLSNRDFHRRIVEAFGPTPRQTPVSSPRST